MVSMLRPWPPLFLKIQSHIFLFLVLAARPVSLSLPPCQIVSWRPVRLVQLGTYRPYSESVWGTQVIDILIPASSQIFSFQFPGFEFLPLVALTLTIFLLHKTQCSWEFYWWCSSAKEGYGFFPDSVFRHLANPTMVWKGFLKQNDSKALSLLVDYPRATGIGTHVLPKSYTVCSTCLSPWNQCLDLYGTTILKVWKRQLSKLPCLWVPWAIRI